MSHPLTETNAKTFYQNGANLTVTAAVEDVIENSVERSYDVTVAEDVITRFLKGGDGAPGVIGYDILKGDWSHPGSARIVKFDDGLEAREEVVALIRPSYFAYQLSDFTGPMGDMVDFAFAEFVFTPIGSRTKVRWTYAFRPKEGQLEAVQAFVANGWVDWMKSYIDTLKTAIQRDPFGA
ncbi:MAG: SRPBCC family protein [Pseudomonadota bacterium]